jgi:hypothetical protein
MFFSQGPAALMLKYQTTLPLDDRSALQAEVDEVWEGFRGDVERAQLTVGMIGVSEKPKGFIFTYNRSYNFVCTKSAEDGQWSKAK